ncbi:MAG: ImmA/IrrE family metallo-endopeptidase [Fimbriimonas sp.]|nr:ImmA/IrrE family metallo-endopeptidase [Fimbriimonas sp.]
MSSVLAPITKEVLVWARETSNREQGELADVAGVLLDRYLEWEAGTSQPTLRQVEQIANKVKIPTIVFFLAEPPSEPKPLLDYRTVTNDGQAGYSPELTLEIRKARYLQSRLGECSDDIVPGWHSGLPALNLTDNPIEKAVELRALIGVSLDQQREFKAENRGLREWRKALFNIGILTFGFRVPRTEALGFSIWHDRFSLAAFNLEGYKAQQVFTLFHELAHLALRQSVVSDLGEGGFDRLTAQVKQVEIFCNRFASAFLLPPGSTSVQDAIDAIPKDDLTSIEIIDKIAKRFRVSKYVVLHRLIESGRIPRDTVSSVFSLWRKHDDDEDEKREEKVKQRTERDKQKGKTIAKSPAAESVISRGESLAIRVHSATKNGLIHSSDAQDLLGIKDHNFESLEGLFERWRVTL